MIMLPSNNVGDVSNLCFFVVGDDEPLYKALACLDAHFTIA